MTKASCLHFTHAQKPFTFYGCPPLLFGVFFMGGIILLLLIKFLSAFIPLLDANLPLLMIIILAACFSLALKLGRQDLHAETLYISIFRFWKSSKQITLLSGIYPNRKISKSMLKGVTK